MEIFERSEFEPERKKDKNGQVRGFRNGFTFLDPNNRMFPYQDLQCQKQEMNLLNKWVLYFMETIMEEHHGNALLVEWLRQQNCRIWSEANPQVYVETPLHPEKLTVWCALWAGGINPYFFKNDEGHNVTDNGDRYRAMITNFFIPELNNHDVQELWFQQDGATCHTARATIDLLKDTFGDRLISRFGPVNWPPRSGD
ncbi:heat shock 70kDa protein 8 [Trichonephila clavipes]|nr:heat shock 70kDa protein 8 [Trichonephila clavipes]